MLSIFRSRNAINLLESLYLLFVFIRYEPDNTANHILLRALRQCANERMKFNNKEIDTLIRCLREHEQYGIVEEIRNALRKHRFTVIASKMKTIRLHLTPINYILTQLLIKTENKEYDQVRLMASAVHNYPHFILGKYKCTPDQFWNEHISYYSKNYNEPFMREWEHLFKDN